MELDLWIVNKLKYVSKINYGDEKIDVFLLDKDIIGEVAAYT